MGRGRACLLCGCTHVVGMRCEAHCLQVHVAELVRAREAKEREDDAARKRAEEVGLAVRAHVVSVGLLCGVLLGMCNARGREVGLKSK